MRHPLHPALVHFPIACWSLATAADFASLRWGKPAWFLAGVLLIIGTLTALAAMASGFLELLKIKTDHPATADLNRHMLLVMIAWTAYAASLFLRLERTTLIEPDIFALATSMIGFCFLGAAGWFGGKLVYGHSLGGDRVPPT